MPTIFDRNVFGVDNHTGVDFNSDESWISKERERKSVNTGFERWQVGDFPKKT